MDSFHETPPSTEYTARSSTMPTTIFFGLSGFITTLGSTGGYLPSVWADSTMFLNCAESKRGERVNKKSRRLIKCLSMFRSIVRQSQHNFIFFKIERVAQNLSEMRSFARFSFLRILNAFSFLFCLGLVIPFHFFN